MSKKIIRGVSLALVLLMFAAVLSGCYEFVFKKYFRDAKNTVVNIHQYEKDGKFEDKYMIDVGMDTSSLGSIAGAKYGLTEKEMAKGVRVNLFKSESGFLPMFAGSVIVTVTGIKKDGTGKATEGKITI